MVSAPERAEQNWCHDLKLRLLIAGSDFLGPHNKTNNGYLRVELGPVLPNLMSDMQALFW